MHSTHFIYSYMEGRKEEFYLTTHSTHFIYGYMEGRKEMFYLTTHSTHFIYSYMEGRKEMLYLKTHSTHFILRLYGRKEGNVLFNNALNTFHLRSYGVRHMVKDHSDSENWKLEMFYLTMHSTHFIYSYMASDIWLRTILIVRIGNWKCFI